MGGLAGGGPEDRGAALSQGVTSPNRHDLLAAAERLHDRALSDSYRGRYDLCSRRVREALALLEPVALGDVAVQRLQVRLQVLLAGIEYELTGGQAGRARLDEAVLVSEQIGARDLTFTVKRSQALLAMRSGLIPEALGYFSAAEALADAVSALEVCKMLVNRGTLQLERLQLDEARRDLESCLRQAGDDPDLVTLQMMAQHNLGYVEFLAGNLPAALRAMSEATELGGGASAAVGLLDRARVLIAAGLIDAADKTLAEAGEQFRAGRMWAFLAECELARAECALFVGDLARARRLAGVARTRFRRRGNDAWRRRSELVLLAGDLAFGRPPTRLTGPAIRLAEEFETAGLPVYAKSARLIACEALLRSYRLTEATALFEATPPPDRADEIALRLRYRTVAALLSRRRGEPGVAHREIRLGLTELGRHQAQFGSVDLQTASALHGWRLARLDLEAAVEAGRPAGVVAALERGRALSRRLVPVTPPRDESAPLLTELRQLTESLRAMGHSAGQAGVVAALRQQIADRQDRLARLAWRSDGNRSVAQPVGLARVHERLQQTGRQMVLYGRTGTGLIAVVLGPDRPRLVRLPAANTAAEQVSRVRADLNVLAYPLPSLAMREAALASAKRSLDRLDEALLAPLGLTDLPVVVVPTADLSTLPWNVLPSLRGQAVEVAPTASRWWHSAQLQSDGPVRVAAFAGPGLAASLREVEGVRRIWPTQEYVGPAATGRALIAAGRSTTIAHVAAHGTHVGQNPLFSSLRLADGPLFAYELEAGNLPPHVVLSACELGQVTVRPGDEALGLTSVLLQLGVRCVVAGVAMVNDDLAAEVMIDYHRRLAAGSDAAVALADAIAATRMLVPFSCFGAAWAR